MPPNQDLDYWRKKLNPQGNLDHTATVLLALGSVRHSGTVAHMKRVALLARAAAEYLGLDQKAALYGALLHDIGKFTLPAELFAEQHRPPLQRKLSEEEIGLIQEHTRRGFDLLNNLHEFTALCVGLHHAVYAAGYGLVAKDFPAGWPTSLIDKVIKISTLISVCDFIDAYANRTLSPQLADLRALLSDKFSHSLEIIEAALEAAQDLRTLNW